MENVVTKLERELDESQPVPTAPQEIYISKEDRLEAENLHLKVVNMAHELHYLQLQIEEKQLRLKGVQKEIMNKRAVIEMKYKIDLSTHEIREGDGLVLPVQVGHIGAIQRTMSRLGQ
jgi:hypothetical protein